MYTAPDLKIRLGCQEGQFQRACCSQSVCRRFVGPRQRPLGPAKLAALCLSVVACIEEIPNPIAVGAELA